MKLTNSIIFLFIPALGGEAQMAVAQRPPEASITWKSSYNVHDLDSPCALLAGERNGCRLVGRSHWMDGGAKHAWWVLDLDDKGKQEALHEFPANQEFGLTHDAVSVGKDVFVIGGLLPWFARVDSAGLIANSNRFRATHADIELRAIQPRASGGFFVAGAIRGPVVKDAPRQCDAWLARVDSEGKVAWSRSFDHGQDETAYAVATTSDGGCVLATCSGKYTKFGQGPSSLWLVRCDSEGNKIAENEIPDGRINPSGRRYIARSGDGFVISYTKSQLPPINQIPVNKPPRVTSLRSVIEGCHRQRV